MRRTAVGLGLLLCVACAARRETTTPSVQDHATPGEIVGELLQGERGEPVSGATVALIGEVTTTMTQTDRRGWFAFRGVAPGAYVVLPVERDVHEGLVVRLPSGRGRRVSLWF
jgi:hypothetical protein